MVRVATIATIANATATQNAVLNPRVSASGVNEPPLRLVATVDRMATPSGAADLLRGVEEARREARLVRRDAGERGDRDRHEREAEPDPDREEAGEEVDRV